MSKEKCKKRLWRGGAFHPTRCSRYAVRDGYCSQHHPDAVELRSVARVEKWEAERAAKERQREIAKEEAERPIRERDERIAALVECVKAADVMRWCKLEDMSKAEGAYDAVREKLGDL